MSAEHTLIGLSDGLDAERQCVARSQIEDLEADLKDAQAEVKMLRSVIYFIGKANEERRQLEEQRRSRSFWCRITKTLGCAR